jgi:hypothetical protein
VKIKEINHNYDDAATVAEGLLELTSCLQGRHLLYVAIVVMP